MNALNIPDADFATAPRVWVDMDSGFGRRVIDPAWVKAYRENDDIALHRLGRKAKKADRVRTPSARTQSRRSDRRMRSLEWHIEHLSRRLKSLEEENSRLVEATSPYQSLTYATARDIVHNIAGLHGISVDAIRGASRVHLIVMARQHAAYEIRRQTKMSSTQIGSILGGRDHTTALHAIREWPKKAARLGIPCEPLERGAALLSQAEKGRA